MKYILLILFSFIGMAGYGQLMQTNNTPGGYQWKAGKFDSLTIITRGVDTPAIGPIKYGVPTVASLFYKTTDSTLWARSATKWNQIAGAGSTTVNWIDILGDPTTNINLVNYINSVFNGSVEYVVGGSAINVDSTGRVYTVNADTSILVTHYHFDSTLLAIASDSEHLVGIWPIIQTKSNDTIYTAIDSTFLIAVLSDGIKSGGYVSWTGTGLTYDISPVVYVKNGVLYMLGATQITLSTADPTDPRYDVPAVDETPGFVVIEGDPAAQPVIPQVNPASQLPLTAILIPAGDTIPDMNVEIIYDEDVEWTHTTTGTVGFANTDNPRHLTIAADMSSYVSTRNISFTRSVAIDRADYTLLKFYVDLKADLPSTSNIQVRFYNGTTAVTGARTIGAAEGFTKTDVGYQTITIPLSTLAFSSNIFNRVVFTFTGAGPGLYFDWAQLQGNIDPGGGGGTGTGTVTIVTATNTYGLNWVITNPTTTPNLRATIDTSLFATKNFFYNSINNTVDSLADVIANNYVSYSDTSDMLAGYVRRVIAGTNVTVDETNPQYPVVNAAGGGSGSIEYVVPGYGVIVDSAARVYTVNVDSTIITSKNFFYNQLEKTVDSIFVAIGDNYVSYGDTSTMLAGYVRRVIAGTNVTVDETNPQYPVVSATGGGGSGWSLTGNAGTNSGTNFVGTTDNRSLRFRTNNTTRMHIDSATGRVGIGTISPERQFSISGSSDGTVLTGGVLGRATDTRLSGDNRFAGWEMVTDGGAQSGSLLAVTGYTGTPFFNVDGIYLSNRVNRSGLYGTIVTNGGVENRVMQLIDSAVAIGYGATIQAGTTPGAFGGVSTLYGYNAIGSGVAVGYKASATNYEAVAIGPQANANALATIAIGDKASAIAGTFAGNGSIPPGVYGNQIVMGDATFTKGNLNLMIGSGSGIDHDYAMCLGCWQGSTSFNVSNTTASHQAILGGYDTSSGYFGNGVGLYNDFYFGPVRTSSAAQHAITMNMPAPAGTNISGAAWTFNGARATGTGTGGSINFATSTPGSTGSAQQTMANRLIINTTGINIPNITSSNLSSDSVLVITASGDVRMRAAPSVSGVTGAGTSGQATFWGGSSSLTGDNAFFWDNTNKRLGISTTTPNHKLDIATTTGAAWIGTSSATAPDGNSNVRLIVGDATSNTGASMYVASNETNTAFNIGAYNFANYNIGAAEKRIGGMIGGLDGAVNSGNIKFFTSNAGTYAERVRIDKAGKVGIGITPTVTLHVAEASFPTLAIEATSVTTPYPTLRLKTTTKSYAFSAGVITSGVSWYVQDETAGATRFEILTGGAGTFRGALAVNTSTAPTDALEVAGNMLLKTAGNKLKITTGSNASVGTSAAMTAGTITISTTAVTANSLIFLTHKTIGGTQGILSVGTITAGTSFVINSSSATDTGTVNWWIVN